MHGRNSNWRGTIAALLVAGGVCSLATSQEVEPTAPSLGIPSAEASRGELQPGVGETFLDPPAIPPRPERLDAAEPVAPPGAQPISLQMLESIACSSNPTLLQARAQIQGELGKAIQAGLWPNPQVQYVAEQIGVGGTAGEWQGAMVQQRIVTAKKLDISRGKFLAMTRAAEWRALEQQYQVLNDVRIHFFRTLARQQLLQVEQELLKNFEDRTVTTREQYNLGQATRAEVHLANVRLQRQRLKVLAARNQYVQAFNELTSLAGADLPLAPLEGSLEAPVAPIAWETALDRLLSESPQLMAARAKLDADEIKVKRETVEPVPDVIVATGVGRNFEAEDTTTNLSIMAEIPLFDWNQGTIRQAEADVARQRAEIARIELMLRRQLAQIYQVYLTAMQHVRNYEVVIIPESRTAYEVLLDSYEDDRVGWPEVLDAEQMYFESRSEYITQLMLWRTNEVLIVGYLLHGGLQAPTGPDPPGHINAVPKPR